MNVDDLKEMIELVKDLAELDTYWPSSLQVCQLVDRAKELVDKSPMTRVIFHN